MNRKKHSKKEVESVLKYAEEQGWTIKPSKNNGHAWGKILCPKQSDECRCGMHCITSIWSTPKSASSFAIRVKRIIDNCTSKDVEDNEDE